MPLYGEDLAYIHDQGFSSLAQGAAIAVIGLLQRAGIREGLVLDLGCGGGPAAAAFVRAGYEVLGLDVSPAMIRLARCRVPRAQFRVGNLSTIAIPPCNAVAAIGEVLNYLPTPASLRRLVHRVFESLRPGGLFVFDLREAPRPGDPLHWTGGRAGRDWAVLAISKVEPRSGRLTRLITGFRHIAGGWRRHDEVHRQRLYRISDVLGWLRKTGFHVQERRRYSRAAVPPGGPVLIARKLIGRKQ